MDLLIVGAGAAATAAGAYAAGLFDRVRVLGPAQAPTYPLASYPVYAQPIPNRQPYSAYALPSQVGNVASSLGGRRPGAPDQIGQALGYAGQAIGAGRALADGVSAYAPKIADWFTSESTPADVPEFMDTTGLTDDWGSAGGYDAW